MKPILFNTEMVRAILDGRKTVTRRIADINTEITCNDGTTNHEFVLDNFDPLLDTPTGFVCRRCGFGVAPPHSRVPCGTSLFRPRYWPGDILYVRETWGRTAEFPGISEGGVVYAADCSDMELRYYKDKHFRWRPSIHMPKEYARLFLRVTSVSVERLQEITEEGAIAEGCCPGPWFDGEEALPTARVEFIRVWDSTIPKAEKDTCGWDANPWVWVIRYEWCEKPEEG